MVFLQSRLYLLCWSWKEWWGYATDRRRREVLMAAWWFNLANSGQHKALMNWTVAISAALSAKQAGYLFATPWVAISCIGETQAGAHASNNNRRSMELKRHTLKEYHACCEWPVAKQLCYRVSMSARRLSVKSRRSFAVEFELSLSSCPVFILKPGSGRSAG